MKKFKSFSVNFFLFPSSFSGLKEGKWKKSHKINEKFSVFNETILPDLSIKYNRIYKRNIGKLKAVKLNREIDNEARFNKNKIL